MSKTKVKERSTEWKPGQSGNPNGRPRGTGRPVSQLRATLRSLREMEQKALDNIRSSVAGDDVDKEVLATSKWVVSNIVTVNRAAVADESLTFNIRQANLARQEEEARRVEEEARKPGGNVRRFTTAHMALEDEDDEE